MVEHLPEGIVDLQRVEIQELQEVMQHILAFFVVPCEELSQALPAEGFLILAEEYCDRPIPLLFGIFLAKHLATLFGIAVEYADDFVLLLHELVFLILKQFLILGVYVVDQCTQYQP